MQPSTSSPHTSIKLCLTLIFPHQIRLCCALCVFHTSMVKHFKGHYEKKRGHPETGGGGCVQMGFGEGRKRLGGGGGWTFLIRSFINVISLCAFFINNKRSTGHSMIMNSLPTHPPPGEVRDQRDEWLVYNLQVKRPKLLASCPMCVHCTSWPRLAERLYVDSEVGMKLCIYERVDLVYSVYITCSLATP